MKALRFIMLFIITGSLTSKAQSTIDSIQFFIDDKPLDATLITDINKLLDEKMKGGEMPATFVCNWVDSTEIREDIRINARGQFRRSYCYIPPLRLNFHNATSP